MATIATSSYDPDLTQEEIALTRRQALAQALQQQASTPLGPTEMVSGRAIRRSPMEGLAKLFAAYQAAKIGAEADQTAQQLALKDQALTAQKVADALKLYHGTNAQPEIEAPSAELGGGPGRPALPATNGDPLAAALALINNKRTAAIGSPMLAAAMKMEEDKTKPTVVGRSLVTPAGKLLATDTTWTEEREAERQREIDKQKSDQAFRDQQARQHASELKQAAEQAALDRLNQIKVAASMRPPPAVQPLVQVMTPQGPQWVERKDAIGKVPAGVGSKEEEKMAGKTDVDRSILLLKQSLDDLKAGGGITSTSDGVISNTGAWMANTGIGQTLGSMGGTNNQKARDVILQARPLLLRSIMSATGMSAKNLDSNAELKLWLSVATDPTKGYEANVEALNNIAERYGSGRLDSGRGSSGKIGTQTSSQPKIIDFNSLPK